MHIVFIYYLRTYEVSLMWIISIRGRQVRGLNGPASAKKQKEEATLFSGFNLETLMFTSIKE